MSDKKLLCGKCGCEKIKVGKLAGIATVQSLDAKTGLGGSEIMIYFCSNCGNVVEMIVEKPDRIK